MSKNTAWGNKAYKETRANGGSKNEARSASKDASDKYHQHLQNQQFGKVQRFNEDLSDFNNSKNNGSWHTSQDL